MKTNKEMAIGLHKEYEQRLQLENDLYEKSQRHYERWEESDCEDEAAYEEYRDTYERYLEAERKTNLIARLVIQYAFIEG